MADTPRTIDEMQALLADNVTGDISPQDIRDMLATLCNLDTDRSEFTSGGWLDMSGLFTAGTQPATNPPTLTQWGTSGIYAWSFTTNDQLFFSFKMPHSFKAGSAVWPHVHWAPSSAMADGETVVWVIEWMAAPLDPTTPVAFDHASPVTSTLTFTSSGVTIADAHLSTEALSGSTIPNSEPGTMVMARVYRAAGTYAGAIFGLSLNAHFQADRFGTKNKEKPYYT